MNLVTSHLTRLTDFSGRENRQPFWLWVLCLYGFQMALSMVATIPMMMAMTNRLQPVMGQDPDYMNRHPELVWQAMMPFMRGMMIFGLAVGLLHVALVAGAVVRRLHDGDRSGWWAAPVLAVQVATGIAYLLMLPRFFGAIASAGQATSPEQVNAAMTALMPSFMLVGLLGMVGSLLMIGLIVLLALRGTVGPNRYGPDPLPPPPAWTPQAAWPPAQNAAAPPPARIVRPWGDPPPT